MAFKVPGRLAANCRKTPERAAWLDRLPSVVRDLERRWSLSLHTPFDGEEVSCAWVARATSAVLKLGMPHMEGRDEIQGLRFWDGNPTVRLLASDDDLGAMLLERCQPGTALRAIPEPEQDLVIAGLLRRLWRPPSTPHPFRPLSALMEYWSEETLADAGRWPDAGLVCEGLSLFRELPRTSPAEELLGTDVHAGNVLRSSGNGGSSSTRSRSSGIRPSMRRSTCSIAMRDCARTRMAPSAASQTCLAWMMSGSGYGHLPARRRNRATIGTTTV